MFSPPVAKAIAFVVAAAIFIGGMLLVATFVAAPLSHWVGEQTRGWPAWATLGTGITLIAALYSLGYYLKRRDQRKAARPTL